MRLHGSAWLRQSYCAGRSAKVSSRSHRLRCAALLTRSPVPIGVPGQSLDKSLKQLSSLGANFDDAEVVSQNLRDVQASRLWGLRNWGTWLHTQAQPEAG